MSYSAQILADTPQAYYRLDETSGTSASDSSGHGYNATLTGVTLGQIQGAITSERDTAAIFTPTGGLTTPNTLNPFVWTSASLEFWVDVGTGWQYVVETVDNTNGTLLYLNGNLTSSGLNATLFLNLDFTFAGNLVLGFNLDEIAIYSYVLSPTQINHHFLAGTTSPSLSSIPPLTIAPSPLGFIGEGILPVTPTVPYTINGTLLDTQPFLTTAPMTVANRLLSRGSVFFLLFSSPSYAVQALIANGTTVTMRFTLVDGTVITGPVQLATTTVGSQWLVMCTTTADISTITPHILTQFA